MTLRLYNSLTKREEPFTPLDPSGKRVTFYTCGPTVYDYAHIGNFRSFLNADVLRRTLELLGHEVRQVMNMTDVGHMSDDEVADGAGEDKMEIAAKRLAEAKKSGKLPPGADVDASDPYAIAEFYIAAFLDDARSLGMKVVAEAREEPALLPRPTRFIDPMIELVEKLIEREHAYVGADGVVYFDVQSYPEYGRLSGNTPEKIRSGEGGRVDEQTQDLKRHPADFMLWKPDTSHLMKWPSPWGEGYPGWHLECSVMAMSLLGADSNGVIDLHSGGEDNIFPHHECEIAQTCGASGAEHFARYWFHTRFLIVEGEKMSKSKGNFFTVRDLLARGASPAAIRLELIKTHYRSNSNFTFRGVKDSQRQIDRWARLHRWLGEHVDPACDGAGGPLASALPAFKEALSNDLNVAGAIGVLNEAAGAYVVDDGAPPEDARPGRGEIEALEQMDSVLGVLDLAHEAALDESDLDISMIESKIAERLNARKAKDWAAADRLRDDLIAIGIEIKDGPEGNNLDKDGQVEDKPIIGLTGGIGGGKSAVAEVLAKAGCVVARSDEDGRAALRDPAVRDTLVEWWGTEILDSTGEVDRSAVAAIVFSDSRERERLESLTHPWIETRRAALFANAPADTPALVIDAPLLVEAGLDEMCDLVIFVDASRPIRLARVRETRGWEAEELTRREDSQLPLDEKRKRADHVLKNEGDLSELAARVRSILSQVVESRRS